MERSYFEESLTEDQSLIVSSVTDFARESVAPRHEAIDHAGDHPDEILAEIAELGLFAILLPEEMGGAGGGYGAVAPAIESMARSAGVMGAHLCAQAIALDALVSAADAVDPAWIEEVAMGSRLASPAFMDSKAGEGATTATLSGDSILVNGEKSCVPHPGRAGLYVVLVRIDGADRLVALDAASSGITHEADETLGLRGFTSGTLRLENTPGVLLGDAAHAASVLDGASIAVAALHLGIAEGAVEHAWTYSGERQQFGKHLRDFPAVQEMIFEGHLRTEALRGLVAAAARLRDLGKGHHLAARRARHYASRIGLEVANRSLQVFGGYGFSREYPAERYYRDAGFPGFGEYGSGLTLEEAMDALEA